MVTLTRLSGQPIVVNADQIVTIESTPDTMLCLHNGEKLVVKEAVDDVIRLVVAFRRRLLYQPVVVPPVEDDSARPQVVR